MVCPPRHPPFLLPREGEETEEEREIPPPGSGGLITISPKAKPIKPNFAGLVPPQIHGDRGEQKPFASGAQRPTDSGSISGRHERREVFRTPGVALAGPRLEQGGGSGPKAVRKADRNEVERVSTRSPGWRCARRIGVSGEGKRRVAGFTF